MAGIQAFKGPRPCSRFRVCGLHRSEHCGRCITAPCLTDTGFFSMPNGQKGTCTCQPASRRSSTIPWCTPETNKRNEKRKHILNTGLARMIYCRAGCNHKELNQSSARKRMKKRSADVGSKSTCGCLGTLHRSMFSFIWLRPPQAGQLPFSRAHTFIRSGAEQPNESHCSQHGASLNCSQTLSVLVIALSILTV